MFFSSLQTWPDFFVYYGTKGILCLKDLHPYCGFCLKAPRSEGGLPRELYGHDGCYKSPSPKRNTSVRLLADLFWVWQKNFRFYTSEFTKLGFQLKYRGCRVASVLFCENSKESQRTDRLWNSQPQGINIRNTHPVFGYLPTKQLEIISPCPAWEIICLFKSSSSVKFTFKTKASLCADTEEPAVTICLDSFCGAQLPVIEQIIVIFGSFLSPHNCQWYCEPSKRAVSMAFYDRMESAPGLVRSFLPCKICCIIMAHFKFLP